MRSIKQQFFHHSIGLVVGLFISLVGATVYDTFINTNPPFRSENDKAVITTNEHHSVFRYTRDLYILKDFRGEVSRHLNPHNYEYPQYTVPSSKAFYKFSKEPYKVDRPFTFEPPLKPGIWCMHATMHWRPTFSLVEHSKDANPVCAEVK